MNSSEAVLQERRWNDEKRLGPLRIVGIGAA